MSEAFCITAVLNLALLFIASGFEITGGAAMGVLEIFMPFTDELVIAWFGLAANMVLSFVVQLLLIKRLEQQWTMLCFLMRKGSRKRLCLTLKKNLYALLGCMAAGKILTDLFFHFAFETQMDFSKLIYIEVSFILAAVLWLELLCFLFAAGSGSNYAVFTGLALTAASLLSMKWIKIYKWHHISIFSYASISFGAADLAVKIILWAAFAAAGTALIMKKDLIGRETV